jgi:hypothetical protein
MHVSALIVAVVTGCRTPGLKTTNQFCLPEKEFRMPVITISRQFGTGGKTLTGQLAARLGYEVADAETDAAN